MKKICKYCSKEIKGKAKNYDYYYFCNNIDCVDKYLNEPEKKDICEYWVGSERCTDKKVEELNILLDLKADNWERLREGTKSDASCDRKWEALPEGRKERRLRFYLKSLEKKMSAIKAAIQVLDGEARNMF